MRTQRTLFAAACLSLLFGAGAQAGNLVPNPHFDQNLGGWIVQEGSAAWSQLDASEDDFSGSLLTSGPAHVRSGCFAVSPGAYEVNARYLLLEDGPGIVQLFMRWYSDTKCSEPLANSTSFGSAHEPHWSSVGTGRSGSSVAAPEGTRSAAVQFLVGASAHIDEVVVVPEGACSSESCLNRGRFGVDVVWVVSPSQGRGHATSLTPDSSFFWFFNASNVELVVKVLDGCAINGHYWVFMAGLTNVQVEVTVTDFATGEQKTYFSQTGRAFQPIQDTEAFATCP